MKKNDTKIPFPLIVVIFLTLLSCIISAVTRYLYPPQISSKWTENIVGLGMAGVLFFGGMFWMLIALDTLRKPKVEKKHHIMIVFLIGMLVMVLGLLIAFAAYQK